MRHFVAAFLAYLHEGVFRSVSFDKRKDGPPLGWLIIPTPSSHFSLFESKMCAVRVLPHSIRHRLLRLLKQVSRATPL